MRPIQKFLHSTILVLLGVLFSGGAALAAADPEIKVKVGNDGGGGVWYTQWWAWVIGAAVFVIVIVAITSRGKK